MQHERKFRHLVPPCVYGHISIWNFHRLPQCIPSLSHMVRKCLMWVADNRSFQLPCAMEYTALKEPHISPVFSRSGKSLGRWSVSSGETAKKISDELLATWSLFLSQPANAFLFLVAVIIWAIIRGWYFALLWVDRLPTDILPGTWSSIVSFQSIRLRSASLSSLNHSCGSSHFHPK